MLNLIWASSKLYSSAGGGLASILMKMQYLRSAIKRGVSDSLYTRSVLSLFSVSCAHDLIPQPAQNLLEVRNCLYFHVTLSSSEKTEEYRAVSYSLPKASSRASASTCQCYKALGRTGKCLASADAGLAGCVFQWGRGCHWRNLESANSKTMSALARAQMAPT